jgi:hypothetical protein
MCQFSPQLIAEITKYFEEKYGETLTPGQAEEYLNSWADLWSAVARGAGRAVPALPACGQTGQPDAPVILDSLHI